LGNIFGDKVKNESNSSNVPQGKVTFKLDGVELGTADVNEGIATIDVIFNETINDKIIAYYHDENNKYNDSHSSEENNNLLIEKGETVIDVTPTAHGYMDTQVTIDAVVKDKNTGAIVNTGKININGESCEIVNGKVVYNFTVTVNSPVEITSYFEGNENYNKSNNGTTIVTKDLIPTVTIVDNISGTVGIPVETITATVTNSSETGNTDNVPQGTVTFLYNNEVIGTAQVIDGVATLNNIIFNHTVNPGTITAEYTDENVKYGNSTSTNNNNLEITKGQANIGLVADPDSGVPGVTSVVTINVNDVNTGLPVNGSVSIDGHTVDVVDGVGSYEYPIVDATSLSGTELVGVFSSPDYEDAEDSVTVTRELIPTTTYATIINNTVRNITLNISVIDNDKKPVDQGSIIITVSNETFTKDYSKELENGNTTIVIDDIQKGTYNFTIVYPINNIYANSSTALDDVEVVGRESEIIPEVEILRLVIQLLISLLWIRLLMIQFLMLLLL